MTSEIGGTKPRVVFLSEFTYEVTESKESTESQPKFSSKALHFKSIDDIDNCESINGISIEEIERRARPKGYSLAGFLGKNESFKEVLKKDWRTVEKFNVTHCEIAAHLRKIIEIAEKTKRGDEIEYRPNDLEGSTLTSEKYQKLEVFLICSQGLQWDLFTPGKGIEREVETPKSWNEEYTAVNPENGEKIRLNSGVLKYIELFGFYEGGGDSNPYRVDPLKVIALLTGKANNI